MLIRETTLDDVPETDRIRRAVFPWHAVGLETQRHWFTSTRPESRPLQLVAEVDGQVVGMLGTGLDPDADDPGLATATLLVHPEFRGRRIGSALHDRLTAHATTIGATVLQCTAMDEPASIAWATARGYTPGARNQFQVVDPRALPDLPATPPGVRVLAAAETGPEVFHRVDDVAARDEPGDVPYTGMPLDRWIDCFWITLDQDVSMVCLVDGEPAATTMLTGSREAGRLESAGSGTLREHRGRGLMKLLKSVSLRRAAELGVTACFTSNNETNRAMLAINTWLGYRPVGGMRSVIRKL